MLSYATPATIQANNDEADRVMKSLGHSGVMGAAGVNRDALKGSRSADLAKVHSDALARRNRG